MYPDNGDLVRVDAAVNCLPYAADAERYRLPDFWERITDEDAGDCEDFALGKLNRLLDLGWPIECLRLACCYVEDGGYHAVLAVMLEDGSDLILDNRQNHPCSVEELKRIGYKPDKIQSVGGSQTWVKWEW